MSGPYIIRYNQYVYMFSGECKKNSQLTDTDSCHKKSIQNYVSFYSCWRFSSTMQALFFLVHKLLTQLHLYKSNVKGNQWIESSGNLMQTTVTLCWREIEPLINKSCEAQDSVRTSFQLKRKLATAELFNSLGQ